MGRFYAENTLVPVHRTRGEIEGLLRKAGATEFGFIAKSEMAQVAFRLKGRMIRFSIPLDVKSKNPEKEERRRWRALALSIKSKLVTVENGITTFDEEFLAHIVVPGDNRTLGEALVPKIEEAYATKKMPKLLES